MISWKREGAVVGKEETTARTPWRIGLVRWYGPVEHSRRYNWLFHGVI